MATAVRALLTVQRAAGNAAVVALLQRQQPGTPERAGTPPAAGARAAEDAGAEAALRLQMARVLGRTRALREDEIRRLGTAIAGSPIYDMIGQKAHLRDFLADRWVLSEQPGEGYGPGVRELLGRRVPLSEIPYGTPVTKADLELLAAEIQRLDGAIAAALVPLGLTEPELVRQVERDFPELWVQRAKQVAYAMLEENLDLVRTEYQRYCGMCAPDAPIWGLIEADRRLKALVDEIEELRRDRALGQSARPPGGEVFVPEVSGEAYVFSQQDIDLSRRLDQKREELQARQREYAGRYPILASSRYVPGTFAGKDDIAAGALVGRWVVDLVVDILRTKAAIMAEEIRVWDLNLVPDLTFQELGVPRESVLGRAVGSYVARKRSDEALLKVANAVLSITAVVLATMVAGPAGGAVVSYGLTIPQLIADVDRYATESAAGNVALQQEFRDISAKDPELAPIILDLVSMGLDMATVVSQAAQLRQPVRRMIDTGDAARFVDDLAPLFGRVAAERAAVAVARRHCIMDRIRQVIVALRLREPPAITLEAALTSIGRAMGPDVEALVRRTFAKARWHFYSNEQTLRAELLLVTRDPAAVEEAVRLSRGSASFYLRTYDRLFLGPVTTAEAAAAHMIHEVQHSLQPEAMDAFLKELMAWRSEQAYLRLLPPELVPEELRYLVGMTDSQLTLEIMQRYGLKPP